MLKLVTRALAVTLLAAFCLLAWPRPTHGALGIAVTVNTAADTEAVDGKCSLREAIIATDSNTNYNECHASGSAGTDGIFFNIAPGGVQTITLSSALPAITGALNIDATGQPAGNDNCGVGKAPCIRLDGSSAGSSSGLKISANGVTVRGLAITGFQSAGIDASATSNITIAGNYIGTADGVTAAGNFYGIQAGFGTSTVSAMTIGGTTASDRNLVSGNQAVGIVLVGNDNFVQGNYVGTTADGASALGNGGGIIVAGGPSNVIGGTAAGAGNVISGNTGSYGLEIFSASTTQVFGNLIGTDASGVNRLGNGGLGILVEGGSANVIGSQDPAARNVISANSSAGLHILNSASNHVERNIIGLNLAGTQALGNNGDGVWIHSTFSDTSSNLVTSNVISGNGSGVHLQGAKVSGTRVSHNLIGTDLSGSAPLGNVVNGVVIEAGSHDNEFQYNTIAATTVGPAISIADSGSTGNSFLVNYIGTNANGDDLANGNAGIYVHDAPNTQIGSETAPLSANDAASVESAAGGGNVIRNNSGSGVLIDGVTATGNAISGNSIDGNGGLGIRLMAGANGGEVAPALGSAVNTGGSTHITGSLTTTPSAAFRIEFFASPACDPSGAGEGRDYLGVATVNTDGAGAATIDATLSPGAAGGRRVTATATDANGNTSQFSNCVTAAGPTPTPTPTPSPSPSPTPTHTATPTPTHSPTPTATQSSSRIQGDINCDGVIDEIDFELLLEFVATLNDGTTLGPCPDIGLLETISGYEWGDVNCDGFVNALDVLYLLVFKVQLHTLASPPPSCFPVGSTMT